MTSTDFKPYTIDELVTMIYEDNLAHFEFMENMNGGDCDCSLHITMQTIIHYWGEQSITKGLYIPFTKDLTNAFTK